jgi:hypothetical protein
VRGIHHAAKPSAKTTCASASDATEVLSSMTGASHGITSHWFTAQLSSAYATIPASSAAADSWRRSLPGIAA